MRVDEHSYFLQSKDMFKQKFMPYKEKIFLIVDKLSLIGIPNLNYNLSKLIQLMDGSLRFKPESEFLL